MPPEGGCDDRIPVPMRVIGNGLLKKVYATRAADRAPAAGELLADFLVRSCHRFADFTTALAVMLLHVATDLCRLASSA